MEEVDQLVDQQAVVPISPKIVKLKPPTKRKTKRTPAETNEIKAAAISVINNAFTDVEKKRKTFTERASKAYVSTPAVLEAFKNFEDALGGRGPLIKALQHCPPTSIGYAMISKLVDDPDFLAYARSQNDEDIVRYALADICKRHRIPFNALVAAFRDGKTAQFAVEALTSVSKKVPKVVEQLAEDATNRWEECHLCEGTGKTTRINDITGEILLDKDEQPVLGRCFQCQGKGRVWTEHDIQNRKMFLQMTKVLDEKAPLVQQTFNQQANILAGNFTPGDGNFEKLVNAVDKVAKAEIIDVQPENNK